MAIDTQLIAAALPRLRAAIGMAAGRTGVDVGYLLARARSESGLEPAAHAPSSSAAGLFQFLDQTWLGVLKRHGPEHGPGWTAESLAARPGGALGIAAASLRPMPRSAPRATRPTCSPPRRYRRSRHRRQARRGPIGPPDGRPADGRRSGGALHPAQAVGIGCLDPRQLALDMGRVDVVGGARAGQV